MGCVETQACGYLLGVIGMLKELAALRIQTLLGFALARCIRNQLSRVAWRRGPSFRPVVVGYESERFGGSCAVSKCTCRVAPVAEDVLNVRTLQSQVRFKGRRALGDRVIRPEAVSLLFGCYAENRSCAPILQSVGTRCTGYCPGHARTHVWPPACSEMWHCPLSIAGLLVLPGKASI